MARLLMWRGIFRLSASTPALSAGVGNDAMGESIRQAMADWGMSIENLQTDPDYPTGTVKVTINKDEPSYEILADQAYDFIAAQQLNPARPIQRYLSRDAGTA